jgi:molybdate transport system substrate-binding protein
VILAGAPDVDRLVELGRVDGESRRVVARNVLVLVGAAGAPAATFRTLADLPRDARVAIGDPRSVPAGRYAQGELERLGVWEALRDRIVPAADVSGVTTWVRRGDVTLGIAYATEVLDVSGLVVLDRADHPDAPAALVVGGACRGARGAEVFGGFLRFLASEGARSVWTRHGFLPP